MSTEHQTTAAMSDPFSEAMALGEANQSSSAPTAAQPEVEEVCLPDMTAESLSTGGFHLETLRKSLPELVDGMWYQGLLFGSEMVIYDARVDRLIVGSAELRQYEDGDSAKSPLPEKWLSPGGLVFAWVSSRHSPLCHMESYSVPFLPSRLLVYDEQLGRLSDCSFSPKMAEALTEADDWRHTTGAYTMAGDTGGEDKVEVTPDLPADPVETLSQEEDGRVTRKTPPMPRAQISASGGASASQSALPSKEKSEECADGLLFILRHLASLKKDVSVQSVNALLRDDDAFREKTARVVTALHHSTRDIFVEEIMKALTAYNSEAGKPRLPGSRLRKSLFDIPERFMGAGGEPMPSSYLKPGHQLHSFLMQNRMMDGDHPPPVTVLPSYFGSVRGFAYDEETRAFTEVRAEFGAEEGSMETFWYPVDAVLEEKGTKDQASGSQATAPSSATMTSRGLATGGGGTGGSAAQNSSTWSQTPGGLPGFRSSYSSYGDQDAMMQLATAGGGAGGLRSSQRQYSYGSSYSQQPPLLIPYAVQVKMIDGTITEADCRRGGDVYNVLLPYCEQVKMTTIQFTLVGKYAFTAYYFTDDDYFYLAKEEDYDFDTAPSEPLHTLNPSASSGQPSGLQWQYPGAQPSAKRAATSHQSSPIQMPRIQPSAGTAGFGQASSSHHLSGETGWATSSSTSQTQARKSTLRSDQGVGRSSAQSSGYSFGASGGGGAMHEQYLSRMQEALHRDDAPGYTQHTSAPPCVFQGKDSEDPR